MRNFELGGPAARFYIHHSIMQDKNPIVKSTELEREDARWRDIDGRSMIIVLLLVYVLVLIRTAWVSDDAYITFRTVDNFVNGFGLRWNVAERVQSFTHPLWLFVVTFVYLITGELFFSSIFLSMAISLAAALLLVYTLARSRRSVALALTVLILSKAFIDYSSSGLENPLTHLLLALFALIYFRFESSRRSLLLLSLVAALGTLNRMDTALLYFPTLVYAWSRLRTWKAIGAVAVGFAPFILWECFSFLYYGSLVPNTAYAKLATGIPLGERLSQGMAYLLNSVSTDPLTLLVIAGVAIVVFVGKLSFCRPLLIGALLYLVYVVYIGGDFMSGRFLTPILLIAVVIVAKLRLPHHPVRLATPFAVVLVVGLASDNCPLYSGRDYGSIANPSTAYGINSGIADERAYYYPVAGLLVWERGTPMPKHGRCALGEAWSTGDSGSVIVGWALGYAGFYAGPDIHIIDGLALNDPLLARLPAAKNLWWRIGHNDRAIPAGYRETHETGKNRIADSTLATFYEHLRFVTRGKLLSLARLKVALRLMLGHYNHLLPVTTPPPMRIARGDVSTIVTQGARWDGEGTSRIHSAGAQIDLGEVVVSPRFEIALDHNDEYRLVFVRGTTPIDSLVLPAAHIRGGGMALHRIDVPAEAVDTGFDAIRLYPLTGDNFYSVGHLRFELEADSLPAAPR
jgi:arabinofuranosyltransferase